MFVFFLNIILCYFLGIGDFGSTEDQKRIDYYYDHITAVQQAIE